MKCDCNLFMRVHLGLASDKFHLVESQETHEKVPSSPYPDPWRKKWCNCNKSISYMILPPPTIEPLRSIQRAQVVFLTFTTILKLTLTSCIYTYNQLSTRSVTCSRKVQCYWHPYEEGKTVYLWNFCPFLLRNSSSSTVQTEPLLPSTRTKHLWRLRLCRTAFCSQTETHKLLVKSCYI